MITYLCARPPPGETEVKQQNIKLDKEVYAQDNNVQKIKNKKQLCPKNFYKELY